MSRVELFHAPAAANASVDEPFLRSKGVDVDATPTADWKSMLANNSKLANRNSALHTEAKNRRSRHAGGANSTGSDETFILTSELWMEQDQRGIHLHAGPKTAQWMFPERGSEEDKASGKVRYTHVRTGYGEEANRMGNPSVTFMFQGGNILPIYSHSVIKSLDTKFGIIPLNNQTAIAIPEGLSDYYLFQDLLNQPKILSSGEPNYTIIHYNSFLYPQLMIKGWFDPQGTSVIDDSEAPFKLEWQPPAFSVYESEPPLHSSSALISAYEDSMLS